MRKVLKHKHLKIGRTKMKDSECKWKSPKVEATNTSNGTELPKRIFPLPWMSFTKKQQAMMIEITGLELVGWGEKQSTAL